MEKTNNLFDNQSISENNIIQVENDLFEQDFQQNFKGDFHTSINAFDDNVSPGGLRNTTLIKLLVCYLIDNSPEEPDNEILLEALLNKGYVNYFEAIGAIDELIARKNIVISPNGFYSLTPAGKESLYQCAHDLPLSVREESLEDLTELCIKKKNATHNKTEIIKSETGYTVICKVLHGDFPLMELKLYAADTDQAEHIQKRFQDNPVKLYSKIASILYS